MYWDGNGSLETGFNRVCTFWLGVSDSYMYVRIYILVTVVLVWKKNLK